jgi:hypothetical protein
LALTVRLEGVRYQEYETLQMLEGFPQWRESLRSIVENEEIVEMVRDLPQDR